MPDSASYAFDGLNDTISVAVFAARVDAARAADAERARTEARARAARELPRRSSLDRTSSSLRADGVGWDAIARCETGGDWSMTGPRFSGGLGFANTTWNGFGGREFADLAGHATREQQIIVAERVYARYGLSGWGCRAYG